MAHSFCNSLIHYVFSTKLRRKQITTGLQLRLWPYLGGIARENGMKALAVGGVEDHAHMLVALPETLSVAKAIQLIKGGSSKWESAIQNRLPHPTIILHAFDFLICNS